MLRLILVEGNSYAGRSEGSMQLMATMLGRGHVCCAGRRDPREEADMAYMQFDEVPAMERAVLSGSRGTTAVTGFSALEWSVIALGRMDGVQSLNRPGIVSHAMSAIFGIRPSSSLADERLEALRRTAVVAWHEPVVSASEKAAFIAADFTTAQYDLLLASVADDRLH